MSGEKILIVDDDDDIRLLMSVYLSREGFEVVTRPTGQGIKELCREHDPKVILLDVALPGENGYELVKKVRTVTEAPVIFISCIGDEADKVTGLGLGGDDYVTKPFLLGELVARVKAHLRRYRKQSKPLVETVSALVFHGLEIDIITRRVKVSGEDVSLSSTEFELLYALAKYPDHLYRPEELFQSIWGLDSIGDIRTLQVHMSNLRKKIEIKPDNPKYIVTIRNRGYKFSSSAVL